MATKSVICGYCETQNEADRSNCIACHGPLYDDISLRRNMGHLRARLTSPAMPTLYGWLNVNSTSVIEPKSIRHPGLSAEQYKTGASVCKKGMGKWLLGI